MARWFNIGGSCMAAAVVLSVGARALAGTRTKLVPGIGICLVPFAARPARFVQHVNITRELNLAGFAAYVLDERGEHFYKALKKSPWSR